MLASTIASSVAASISASQSSMQPMCSVAEAALVVRGDGHALEDPLDLLLARSRPSAQPLARARPATSSCAHGQAVMPVAETPTIRRVPRSEATARPCSV